MCGVQATTRMPSATAARAIAGAVRRSRRAVVDARQHVAVKVDHVIVAAAVCVRARVRTCARSEEHRSARAGAAARPRASRASRQSTAQSSPRKISTSGEFARALVQPDQRERAACQRRERAGEDGLLRRPARVGEQVMQMIAVGTERRAAGEQAAQHHDDAVDQSMATSHGATMPAPALPGIWARLKAAQTTVSPSSALPLLPRNSFAAGSPGRRRLNARNAVSAPAISSRSAASVAWPAAPAAPTRTSARSARGCRRVRPHHRSC